MASFTDQISKFNPYIEQLPVEAMAQVGMYKQQQYNAGVQKIQSYIDNVAGIKTLRPQDDQYVKSKLDELGGKLRNVAAGDFSNQQLVNSVGGMATSVVKDPIIQAAVYSYSNDSKNLQEMDADRKKGELTPQAENYYKEKRNAYLNNKNLTDEEGKPITFSGKYIKSWDLDGNLIKAIDAVGDREFTAQQIFKTKIDPTTGKTVILHDYRPMIDPRTKQPVIDKATGKPKMEDLGPMLSDAAVEAKKKGKFSENVQAAIDAVFMRPEAQQELAMRGVYEYRGYDDVNDFVELYEREKNKGVTLLEERKLDLMSKVATETDPDKKKQYQDMMVMIDNEITNISSITTDKINQVKEVKNLEGYKSALYQQRMRNLYMTSGVTETESRTYVKNEALASQREAIEKERAWVKAKHDMKVADFNATTSRMNTTLEYNKWDVDPTNPKNPNSPLNPNYKPPFLEGGANNEDYFVNFVDKGVNVENNYNATKEKFVIDWLKTVNSLNGKSVTDAEVRATINKYQATDPNFVNRKFEEAKENVRTNATNSKYANLVSSLPIVDASEKALQQYYDESESLDKELKANGVAVPDVSKVLKPTIYTYGIAQPGGGYKKVTANFTSKDVFNVALLNSSSGTPKQREKAIKELSTKTGVPVNDVVSTFGGLGLLDPNSSSIPATLKPILQAVTILNSAGQDAAIKAKGQLIKDRGLGNSPIILGLHEPGTKEEDKKLNVDRLKQVLNKYGVADEDVEKFAAAYAGDLKDASNVQFNVNRGGAGGSSNDINLGIYTSGTLGKELTITKDDMDYIKGFVTKLPATKSAVVERVQFYKQNNGTNKLTSDPNDPNAYKGAFYKSSDFFNLKRNDIMGADVIINSLGQPTAWFYVNTKNGVIGVPVKEDTKDILPRAFSSVDATEKFIKSINNSSTFDNILKIANIK